MLLFAALAPVASSLAQSDRDEKYLLGWTSADSICLAMPTVKPDEGSYQPDQEAVAELRRWQSPIEILVFVGSWCSDTRHELPGFLKTLHGADNPAFRVRYFGLDRSKQDSAGIALRHGITSVPTFIFLRDGQELGRIVEQPAGPMEQEWLRVLRNDRGSQVRIGLWRAMRAALRGPTIF